MRNLLLFMLACAFSMPAYSQVTCNASFSTSVSGYTVTLTNSSTPASSPTVNTHYFVNWGDNTPVQFSNYNNNLTHVYASSGSYFIQLYSHAYDSTSGTHLCNDSASGTVNINVPPPNAISGRVYFDSLNAGPTDSIMIWLITFDSSSNILAAVDSQRRHVTNPFYSFTNKAAGQYRTKAAMQNGQTSGTGDVPTYHTSALLWSNATVINHTAGMSINKDIHMQTGTLTSGPGFVGGNVSQGANKGTANGIANMTILLLNANNDPVAYATTDANGDYSFSSLPVGTYKVHPENIGYNTTPATLTITANTTSLTDINFERSLSQKTIVPIASGISNVNNNEPAFSAYPNPATDVININWNKQSGNAATVTITDISGKNVFSSEVKMDTNAVINISNIQAGFYFLNVATEAGSSTQKLLIQ